ncbi:hypothetical protein J4421_03750 [Candidatus Woesearchaeota archaeon]|nr:hypothetical protein [Candidatus Woesearchaeota archaeon]
MIILLTITFFLILFFFGWQTASWVLNENRIERLIALSGIFGIGLYLFFLNIIGFFIQIQIAFYAVLFSFLFLATGGILWQRFRVTSRKYTLEWGIDKKWRWILLSTTLFFVVSVGLISFRHPMDFFTLREPTAVTISEGNFPPREIWSPENRLRYHYASDLLSAAIHKVTGVPIYLAYDFQKAVLSGTLFLMAFILINSFFPSVFVAFWSSTLMFYSGSLIFLKGLGGITALFDKYILGKEVAAPFKFITEAIGEESGLPVINYIVQIHWGAMAFVLMLVAVYIYFHLLNRNEVKNYWPAVFVAGFLLAFLALVAESYFVILAVVLFIFPFILFFFRKYNGMFKKSFTISFLILLIAIPTAIFQGGVLKSAVYQELRPSFGNADEVMLYTDDKIDKAPIQFGTPLTLYDGKPIYDVSFLVKWLLLFAVLVPAFVFLFKRHFELAIFLTLATLLFFEIPFFFYSDFPLINENLERFFYPVNLFGGLVAGLFLATLFISISRKSWRKLAILFLVAVLTTQGLWTHFVWFSLGYPPGGSTPNSMFFAKDETLEGDAYKWVKENTTMSDQFLIIKDEYSECGFSGAPNCLFILNTGRMAPIFRWHQAIRIEDNASSQKIDQFNEVSKNCNFDIVQKLGFTYLYVDERWSNGMEKKCLESNELDLVFNDGDEANFVRIYSIKSDNMR